MCYAYSNEALLFEYGWIHLFFSSEYLIWIHYEEWMSREASNAISDINALISTCTFTKPNKSYNFNY